MGESDMRPRIHFSGNRSIYWQSIGVQSAIAAGFPKARIRDAVLAGNLVFINPAG